MLTLHLSENPSTRRGRRAIKNAIANGCLVTSRLRLRPRAAQALLLMERATGWTRTRCIEAAIVGVVKRARNGSCGR